MFDLSHWQKRAWTKGTRWYACELTQDLWGRWTVIRRWGSRSSRVGQHLVELCESADEAQARMSAVAERRRQRGYELVAAV